MAKSIDETKGLRYAEKAANGVMNLADMAGKAIQSFIQSRADSNPNARIMQQTEPENLMVIDRISPEVLQQMKDLLDKQQVPYLSVQNSATQRFSMLIRKEDLDQIERARTICMAAAGVKSMVDKDVLKGFTEKDLDESADLSFTDAKTLSLRLKLNKLMFSYEKNDDGTYSIQTRAEDREKVDLLKHGLEMERETEAGKKMHAYDEYLHGEAMRVISPIEYDHQTGDERWKNTYLLTNEDAQKALYVDERGAHYREEGKEERFISRGAADFTKQVADLVVGMSINERKDIISLRGKLADELALDLKKVYQDKPLGRDERTSASRLFGKGIKNITEEEIAEKEQGTRGRDLDELARVKRAVAVYHTRREEVDKLKPTQTEKDQYLAMQDIRTSFEAYVTASRSLDNLGSLYMDNALNVQEMAEILDEKQFTPGKTADWRSTRDSIPAFIDRDGDGLDDVHQKNSFSYTDPGRDPDDPIEDENLDLDDMDPQH